jgi:WD40 repeat protein
MELVRGQRITDYCDQQRLGAQERLELFVQLCGAIQHAHQKGIIHRDIKPSNVLVATDEQSAPQLKVIDFGVAKAAQGKLTDQTCFTALEQFIGTPAYMSPEQADLGGQDIDTRSDIYSLGILLYELLTGRTPFDPKQLASDSFDAMRQRIREEEPWRPSTFVDLLPRESRLLAAQQRQIDPARLAPALRGDLDWIVMKCLEKDRTRRYETASALAADIQRHLNNEPVLARPPSKIYRIRKLYQRNRVAATAAMAVLAALVLGIVASTIETVRANHAQAIAVTERANAVQQRNSADEARRLAEQRGEQLRRNLYAAQLNMSAQASSLASGLPRVNELLSPWRATTPDLRGWEWYYLVGLEHRDLLTFGGHVRGAWSVAWSPDSRYIAVCGVDRMAYLYDTFTGNRVRVLADSKDELQSIAWSPDGRLIAAGGRDLVVHLWDARSGRQVRALSGHASLIEIVAFSPDSRRLITGGSDKAAFIWDLESGSVAQKLFNGEGAIRAAAWSPDGRRFAVTVRDRNEGTIKVVDAGSYETLSTFVAHAQSIKYLAWSPDSQKLASASNDRVVKVWEPISGKALLTLRGHTDMVQSVSWSPDGTRLVTASQDATVIVWDALSGAAMMTFRGHLHAVQDVAWSPDGSRIASASQDGTVKVWNAADGSQDPVLTGHSGEVHGVAFSPDGMRLCSVSSDTTARIWDLAARREIHTIPMGATDPRAACWSPDGSRIAITGGAQTLSIYDPSTGNQLAAYPMQASSRAVAWSADGRWIAAGTTANDVKIFDAASGTLLKELKGHTQEVTGVCWSPDGKRIASSSLDQLVKVWDIASGKATNNLRGEGYQVRAVAWSPDGHRIASANYFQTVSVWDADTGRLLETLRGQAGVVESVAWNPDGTRLAAAGWEGTIKVWDLETATDLVTLRGHNDSIFAVDWSRDGTQIASAGASKRIMIHDATIGYAESGSPLALPPLDRRISLNPQDWDALRMRAALHARLGHWDLAASDAEKYLARAGGGEANWFAPEWWVAESAAKDAADSSLGLPDKAPDPTKPGGGIVWRQPILADDQRIDLSAVLGESQRSETWLVTRVWSAESTPIRLAGKWCEMLEVYANSKPCPGTRIAGGKPATPLTEPDPFRAVNETHHFDQLFPMSLQSGWNTVLVHATRTRATDAPTLMLEFEPPTARASDAAMTAQVGMER